MLKMLERVECTRTVVSMEPRTVVRTVNSIPPKVSTLGKILR